MGIEWGNALGDRAHGDTSALPVAGRNGGEPGIRTPVATHPVHDQVPATLPPATADGAEPTPDTRVSGWRASGDASGVRRFLDRAGRAMADQVLSSGAQLLLLVLVARQAGAATFGALSVALVAHGFLLGMVRAGIGEVVLLRCRAGRASTRRDARVGLFLAGLAGMAAGLGLLGAAAVVGGEVGHFLMLVAAAAPLVYVQDLLRYVAYGVGNLNRAILVDGVWLGAQIVVSALLLAAGEATPTRFVLAWMVGAGLGALAGTLGQRLWPRPVAVGHWWAEERARAGGFVTDFLVSNGMWQGGLLVLTVLLPLEEFAALRVAFVSLQPLANLMAGVRTLLLAHLAGLRTRPARARRRAIQLAFGLAGTGAGYGIGLVLLPDRWGSELFGDLWAEAVTLVGVVAIGLVFRMMTFAAIDLVKVLGAPRDLVRTRLTGGVGVVAGLLVGTVVAGALGAAVGATVGYALNSVVWWRRGWSLGHSSAARMPTARI